jgi:hypothetical protein
VTTTVDAVELVERADAGPGRRDLVAALAAAVAFDLAVRSWVACLAGALAVVVVAAGLAASGRLRNPQARLLAAAAPVFGFFLMWRASPWLVLPDILAAGGLLVGAASFARGGSVADVSIPDIVGRGLRAAGHSVVAPAHLVAAVGRFGHRPSAWAAVVRGAMLAVPLVLVIGLLLASADVVFASFFDVSFAATDLWEHLLLGGVGAWGMAALLRAAWDERPHVVPESGIRRLGTVEATVVLGSLVALYGAFTVAQLVAVSEGGKRVLETAGLTYAEYARSGFFQLLAVATITFVVLLALDNGERVVRVLSGAAVVLTLGIVAVALRRLALYEDAFGLTMLRLYSMVFAVWIGAVFVLLGCRLAGLGAPRQWLMPAAAAVGLAMLFVLNVMNPEAYVARRSNDPAYNRTLSPDAGVCPEGRQLRGWAAWNRSVSQACRGR